MKYCFDFGKTDDIIDFIEATFEKCRRILYFQKCKDFKYYEIELPESISFSGYHKDLYKKIMALNKKYKIIICYRKVYLMRLCCLYQVSTNTLKLKF